MLGTFLLNILSVCTNSSVYRNFNIGGLDLEDKNSMLMSSSANPLFNITNAMFESPMTSYADESKADSSKSAGKARSSSKSTKKSDKAYEDDSQSSTSLSPKPKKDDDDSD